MDLEKISIERERCQILLNPLCLQLITKALKNGCNFLVFGVGNDSSFWLEMNKNGKTIFIEDDEVWADEIRKKCPEIKIFIVNYNTKLSDWNKLIDQPQNLSLELSDEIKNTKWDVILVDAPMGFEDSNPGRMKSIYQASILIKKRGHVFVDDCDRVVEKVYANKYLLRENLVEEVKNLRHFVVGRRDTLFYRTKDFLFIIYSNLLSSCKRLYKKI